MISKRLQDENAKLAISSPHLAKPRWLSTSGNQHALESLCILGSRESNQYALQKNAQKPNQPRVVLVKGNAGAGLSSLLSEFESRSKHRGNRILSVKQGTEADERYILSNLVEELNVPNAHWSQFSTGLGLIYERVLFLRRYDQIVIHDVQRFFNFSARVTNVNFVFLVYLLHFPINYQLVIGGNPEAIELCVDRLRAHEQQQIAICPMGFDQRFKKFISDAIGASRSAKRLSDIEVASIHHFTQGLVGETIIYLDFFLSRAASESSEEE